MAVTATDSNSSCQSRWQARGGPQVPATVTVLRLVQYYRDGHGHGWAECQCEAHGIMSPRSLRVRRTQPVPDLEAMHPSHSAVIVVLSASHGGGGGGPLLSGLYAAGHSGYILSDGPGRPHHCDIT